MGNPQNGTSSSNGTNGEQSNGRTSEEIIRTQKIAAAWNQQLSDAAYLPSFHGDALIGDKIRPSGFFANLRNRVEDVRRIVTFDNLPALGVVLSKMAAGGGLDMKSGAKLIGSMANDSNARAAFTGAQVKKKYDRMLHPPLTYLGDAFKYRTADGKFNSALNPHLGQAGAPYAKTVPCKTHPLGALPDAGDIFDCLMAREEGGRESKSGLSSMLIYHATIIIHDIFRTNDKDKNISDTSSYLDLSPLYGFTEEMVRKVRDDKYKLGLLKPDTFAEDRLLRQPPGVCIMLVMYNRYHNYAATQLRRINENDRFSVPDAYKLPKLAAAAKYFASKEQLQDPAFKQQLTTYAKIWREHEAKWDELGSEYDQAAAPLQAVIDGLPDEKKGQLQSFYDEWEKAWDKLDDDLFNTARLITCGQFIQVSIHDYLRALMGFHQFNTDFTLDPRLNVGPMGEELSRGIGNQVTVEFNLLYRFHCAISLKDERYAEDFMRQSFGKLQPPGWDPKTMGLQQFMGMMKKMAGYGKDKQKTEPWDQEFGLPETPELNFKRNPITGLFDDQQMINELTKAMDDPISNFGPRNVPKCMKPIEILGILQARKWGIGTLNDFRDFFGMKRHTTFESITKNKDVQDALRDLYEHPDKVELYPGVFCESDANMGADPGPSDVDSALWAAIFSDAITLVRSDRFYTVDWNTESLTSWGMKEVTPDHDNLKSSVFHRLLQRAFPEWFPYDSVRFFHPFYTSAQNAKFAQEQGYGETFKMDVVPGPTNFWGTPKSYTFKTEGSNPNRPQKPMHLKDRASIKALLADGSDKLIHPSRLPSALKDMPPLIAEVLKPGQQRTCVTQLNDVSDANTIMMDYFTGLVRDVVKREFIVVDKHAPVYQIDVTRDLAIPVITRYVADFLGFGHLVRSDKNPGAAHSENEIYKHITNCQVFLSYNADETKLLKRRHDFKTSMAFLLDLTRRGSMREACKWSLTRVLGGLFGKKRSPMSALGFRVAQQILKNEKDEGRAAAILLLIGLDGAYNAVLAFTSVLDQLLEELYGFASGSKSADFCPLLKLQQTAFDDSPAALDTLSKTVLKEQRKSVRLPVIRKAVDTCDIKNEAGDVLFTVKKGQTVICDIHAAEEEPTTSADEADYLSYTTSFSSDYSAYHPKHIAALSVAALIKVLAQMRNLRRGVDRQGVLKKINLASSSEGYSNFMAPMRMMAIEAEVEKQLKEAKAQSPPNKERVRELEDLFTTQVLKPATDTYLTPEWDEMVPFPTTWKVRFDGFGRSDYGGADFPMLREVELPDDVPPFYQPQGGSSRYGGSFAGCMCPGTGTHDGGSKATVNGDAKTNAVTNGHTNGYTNGHTNGHTNGYSSSLKAGSTTSVYAVSAGCGLPDHVHV